MPIVVSEALEQDCLYRNLHESGALLISAEAATHQDIRPARIGLLNLMPAAAMQSTEVQWLRHMSQTVLQVEPILIKFDDDPRDEQGRSRRDLLARYTPFADIVDQGLDGLVITGDNLELRPTTSGPDLLPFEDIMYAEQLREVCDWARENVHSTIYSCLASHFILNHLYGIDRQLADSKVFGVFEHQVLADPKSQFTQNLDDIIRAPHSRWGDIPTEQLKKVGVAVLAASDQIGWLLAQDANSTGGLDLFIQGHPEYGKHDLQAEHLRDGASHPEPANYYNQAKPQLTWANDARALHANWIESIYRHFPETSIPGNLSKPAP